MRIRLLAYATLFNPGAGDVALPRVQVAAGEELGPVLGRVALVERYDTVSFSDFSAKLSNFRGLVLFCIEADFCDQILIFQHFSRSTRFTHFRTARNSEI